MVKDLQQAYRDILEDRDAPLGLCSGCAQEFTPGDVLPAVMLAPVVLAVMGQQAVVVVGVCGVRHKGALGPAPRVQPGQVVPGMIPGIGLNGA